MIYRVRYSSMTASYGPAYIEADDAYTAKIRFAQGAFSKGEMSLITATPVSSREITQALRDSEE